MDYSTTSGVDAGTSAAAAGISGGMMIFWLVIAVASIVGLWKIFVKAGKPGWAAIVPFYNLYVMLQIVGRPGWWLLLFLIPYVNIVFLIIVAIDLAKSFGKSTAYGVLALGFFSFVGYPLLGFGKDKYIGPSVKPAEAPAATPPASTPPAPKV
jgi:hypothetical protein